MMDVKNRIVIKQGVGIATVPVSADHRNGDWIATDIYEGEMYLNTTDGLLYTRNINGICDTNGNLPKKHYRALISQSGTADPTVIEFDNTIGAIVWSRISAGKYMGTLTNAFTVNKVECMCGTPNVNDREFLFYRKSVSVVELYTYEANVLTDALLTNLTIDIVVNP